MRRGSSPGPVSRMADGGVETSAQVIIVPALGGVAQDIVGRVNLGHAVFGIGGPVDIRVVFFGKGAVSRVNYLCFRFGINLQYFVVVNVRFAFKFSQNFSAVMYKLIKSSNPLGNVSRESKYFKFNYSWIAW